MKTSLKLPWDACVHSARHTALTNLGLTGVDPFTLQRAAGHANIATKPVNSSAQRASLEGSSLTISGPTPMNELRLPSTLEKSQRVLVAGAGGGFDVYAGLPIYERLRSLGKKVFLANLSFVSLETTNAQALTRALYAIEPDTTGADLYFPERDLAQFLTRRGENVRVYAFEKLGVAPIRESYLPRTIARSGRDSAR